jgi:lysophospholipase L1-like esterase
MHPSYLSFLLLSCIGMTTALPSGLHCSPKPPAFFLAGDSTTAIQSTNGGGWGNGFLSYLKSPAWGVNYGHNGATTVSFVDGGDWDTVLSRVKEAKGEFDSYVTIQVCIPFPLVSENTVLKQHSKFGHNDQKAAANISLAQYQANLVTLAQQVSSVGGTPILITPLTRRNFNATTGKVIDSLHNERLATLAAAETVGCRVLDLNLASARYVARLGNETSQVYGLNPSDRTHVNERGSTAFGRMVADLLLGVPAEGFTVEGLGDLIRGFASGACFERWVGKNLGMSVRIWSGLEA